MKISFLFTGKTEVPYICDGLADYIGRIKKYTSFERIEILVPKSASTLPPLELMRREAELQRNHFNDADILVLLDERGKEMRSAEFAAFLNRQFLTGKKRIVFLTGGSYGFDESVRKRADHQISLSKMTFPHQLVRLILAEQLYRALTILRNESYHHE